MGRGKGDGSIYKTADGVWRASVELPAVNGKRRRKKFTGRTQAEVRDKLDDAQRKLGQGEKVSTARGVTVEKAAIDWLALARMNVAAGTYQRYDSLVRNQIVPHLGARAVKIITPACVATFYRTLLETKSERTGKLLSNRTVQQAGAVLSLIFDTLEVANPCLKAKKPQPPSRSGFSVWSPDDIATFLKDTEADRYFPLYVLALGSGARQGELLALKWADFDEAAGTVSITKSLEEVRGKFHIKEPRNKTSFRAVTLYPKRHFLPERISRKRS